MQDRTIKTELDIRLLGNMRARPQFLNLLKTFNTTIDNNYVVGRYSIRSYSALSEGLKRGSRDSPPKGGKEGEIKLPGIGSVVGSFSVTNVCHFS